MAFSTITNGPNHGNNPTVAQETLEARRANATKYNNYIRASTSPLLVRPQTAPTQSTKKTVKPAKKKKKKNEEDAPTKELYSFPSIGQIRKMTPLKTKASPEKHLDASFTISATSEVFGSMSQQDQVKSPSFVLEADSAAAKELVDALEVSEFNRAPKNVEVGKDEEKRKADDRKL